MKLLSPIQVGKHEIRNRLVSTAHAADTSFFQPGKSGEVTTLIARVGEARVAANSADPAVCAALRQGKVSGRPVRIEPGEGGINAFAFI